MVCTDTGLAADAGPAGDMSSCLHTFRANAPGAQGLSRLAVSFNVTLTPLDLATAAAPLRRRRSMVVAHLKPRVPALSARTAARSDSGVTLGTEMLACQAVCSAMAGVMTWTSQARTAQASGAKTDASHAKTDASHANSASQKSAPDACSAACLASSHPDPQMAALAQDTIWGAETVQERSSPHTHTPAKMHTPLPWYPRAPARHESAAHAKLLSWVRRALCAALHKPVCRCCLAICSAGTHVGVWCRLVAPTCGVD